LHCEHVCLNIRWKLLCIDLGSIGISDRWILNAQVSIYPSCYLYQMLNQNVFNSETQDVWSSALTILNSIMWQIKVQAKLCFWNDRQQKMFITEIRRSIFKTTDYGGNKKKFKKVNFCWWVPIFFSGFSQLK